MTAHNPKPPVRFALVESRVIVISDSLGRTDTTIDNSQREFVKVVINNMLNPITIDQLAELCGLTTSKFKRKFKAYFGTSPHKWITLQRLGHAKTLLLDSTLSVKEIGFACGFTSPSHFIRIFKAHFGTTPAALRSALLNRALKNGVIIYK